MHATDNLAHRSGLLVARAAADASGTGVAKPQAVVAEVRPTEAECVAYMDALGLDGFTILPTIDTDADEIERLHEDDGA